MATSSSDSDAEGFDEVPLDMDRLADSVEAALVASQALPPQVDAHPAATLATLNPSIELHEYQIRGVNFLCANAAAGLGSILGDEMGLGKTMQSLVLLAWCHARGSVTCARPALVLAPVGVLSVWATQLSVHAPGLSVYIHRGAKAERAQSLASAPGTAVVVLTTYEFYLRDVATLGATFRDGWSVAVLDEAHRFKNLRSKGSRAMFAELRPRAGSLVLLTGTPLSNSLRELHAVLALANPTVFVPETNASFAVVFARAASEPELQRLLQAVMAPFVLRRLRADVLTHLPKQTVVSLVAGLTRLQRTLYVGLLRRDAQLLAQAGASAAAGALQNTLIQLRKVCNHPYLFDGVEPEPYAEGEHLVAASAKLQLLDALLAWALGAGLRVLVFAQSTRMLDILQDFLALRQIAHERLDGSVRGDERAAAIRGFDAGTPSAPPVFLLTTRAGGLGLNLVSAQCVVLYDSDWSPQADAQAAARVNRIGQTRETFLFRLVTANSVDEIVTRRATAKATLAARVLDGHELGPEGEPSRDELLRAVRFGVSALLESIAGETSATEAPALGDAGAAASDATRASEQAGQAVSPARLPPILTSAQIEHMIAVSRAAAASAATRAPAAAPQAHVASADAFADGVTALGRESVDESLVAAVAAGTAASSAASGAWELAPAPAEHAAERDAADVAALASLAAVVGAPGESAGVSRARKRRGSLAPRESLDVAPPRARKRAPLTDDEKRARALARTRARFARADFTSLALAVPAACDEPAGGLPAALISASAAAAALAPGELYFVSGDAARPQTPRGAPVARCEIVFVPTDASGRWGRGGLFAAVDAVSSQPAAYYTRAGDEATDALAVGDAHLVPLDGSASEPGQLGELDFVHPCGRESRVAHAPRVLVALAVVHRREHGVLTDVLAEPLATALTALAEAALRLGARVHLPRMGGASAYAVERLIRRCLVARGIDALVYYCPRRVALTTAVAPAVALTTAVAPAVALTPAIAAAAVSASPAPLVPTALADDDASTSSSSQTAPFATA